MRKVSRRSFLSSVTANMMVGGGAVLLVSGSAGAQNNRYSGVTDCDTGNGADRPGYGTGNRNQYTDQDTGPNSDPRCRGRGPGRAQEGYPSGAGNYGGGYPSTCTDTDRGSNADPAGRGTCGRPRSTTPTNRRYCSDSDSGQNHDPGGYGRRC